MRETMRLTAEDCAATFNPADGGRLTSFVVGDHELLVAQGKDVFHFGSFVMAPWVGRLRDARLDYGGSEHRFTANAGPHALHGLVTERPWQVTGDGELSIDLDDPWPWPCRVVQHTQLIARRATFRIELHAREAMPAAIGWHPVASPGQQNPPNLNLMLSQC
jgi:aldose 1-epimerase